MASTYDTNVEYKICFSYSLFSSSADIKDAHTQKPTAKKVILDSEDLEMCQCTNLSSENVIQK